MYKILFAASVTIAIVSYTIYGLGGCGLVIKISNGNLRGRDQGFYYSYEGIPYAAAPVGDLRFEAPQPYTDEWTEEFNATQPPNPCMQWNQFKEGDDKLEGVEDCLTVNIYKPKIKRDKYPVMVYLHGGCFMFGDVNLYNEEFLMQNGNIILVKVVYRLGPLGFLSMEDDIIPGNFGLKDQQLALEWVKENIASFGGDPDKIMLTGFSAGGAATHMHILNPKLQELELATTAVSFSGVALNPWALVKNAKKRALKMSRLMKCPCKDSQEMKTCLQDRPAEEIVSAVRYFLNFGYNPFTTFGPVIERADAPQAFMTQHPRDIIKSGQFSHIPWLASYTKDDGGYNAAELLQINPKTDREYIYDLNEHWLALAPKNLFLENVHDRPQDYAKCLRKRYMGEMGFSVTNYHKVQKMYTDILFRNGVVESLNLHRMHQETPVFGYIYDNPADYCVGYALSQRDDIEFGTNHVDDVSLIFNCHIRRLIRPDETLISEKLIQMLVDFADTGCLSFGDCEFEENTKDSEELKMMSITCDGCQSIEIKKR